MILVLQCFIRGAYLGLVYLFALLLLCVRFVGSWLPPLASRADARGSSAGVDVTPHLPGPAPAEDSRFLSPADAERDVYAHLRD